ncbi:hypothetical protein B7494_g6478 [Chlorociboria aeruginascens]|nr:hypothetical protein B7494_g6478 [Chlorociboria aeruginascens]
MPIQSRWNIPIPVCSLSSYLFGLPGSSLANPNRVAFYDADRPDTHYLTFESFRLWSQRIAAGLQKAGVKPGDRVLLFSGNSLFYPILFMGISMAGGVFTGANPGYIERELAYQLKDSGAKFLICVDASLESGIEAARSIGMGKDRIFLFDDKLFEGNGKSRLGVRNWNYFLESEDVGKQFRHYEPEDPKDATCCLNYSSGTTGVPKGVMVTHYNYVANSEQFAHLGELDPRSQEQNGFVSSLLAQTIFIAGGPRRAIPVYIMKKFDFVRVLENIQKFKITTLTMVPPIVVAFAKSPLTKKYDLSSILELGCGAAPLGGDVIAEFEALWPSNDRKIKQGWGMTEATCSLLGWDSRGEIITNGVGELNANCSAKIMDIERGSEVSVDSYPRLTKFSIMKGYWNNPSATSEIFVHDSDGKWMRTGDIAYVDQLGRFFIVDRMKELIKVKGNQVAPAELEALLLEHPMVIDACVVGVTICGEEVPRAYVVGKDGGERDEKDIAGWLSKRVSKHKRLAGGIAFVDAIPKNPSGKLLRKVLREKAQLEVGDKKAQL